MELIIAMQLGSMSLHKRLEDCREQGLPGVPVAELLEYLEQAARGIDFLNKPIHDLGKGPVPIVHGDVKPHNILVVGDAAVVCDFGLARAVETLRKTSMAPVTVAYAAPESFKGKVTPTSDQYSLAITYAELRTGRLPFDETMTPYQVMEAHVTRNLDFAGCRSRSDWSSSGRRKANPEDRWPSSRDMILALRHAVAKTGELPLRPGEAAYTGGPTPSHSTHRPAEAARYRFADANSGRSAQRNDASRRAHAVAYSFEGYFAFAARGPAPRFRCGGNIALRSRRHVAAAGEEIEIAAGCRL